MEKRILKEMRLIDANQFEVMFWKAQGSREYDNGFNDGVDYVVHKIDKAETVFAIPIRWLEMQKFRANHVRDYSKENIIGNLINEWEKEQEAIEENSNEGKTGTWEPLGHIIGYMNHPYSEYYKCSLCGYEQYTVFNLPPDTCPVCRAHLIMEQETR